MHLNTFFTYMYFHIAEAECSKQISKLAQTTRGSIVEEVSFFVLFFLCCV